MNLHNLHLEVLSKWLEMNPCFLGYMWNILSLSVIGVAVGMNNILMVKKAR